MVKPPKTMQPESVNLVKAGRDVQRAFQEDSFHNYMARKIDMQRQQFGLLIPPDPLLMLDDDADNGARVEDHPRNLSHETTAPDKPQTPAPSNKKTIRFALPEATTTISPKDSMRSMLHRSRSAKKFGVMSVLQRLQRRHGTTRSQKTKKRRLALPPQQSDDDDTTTTTNPSHTAFSPSPQNTLPPGCHSIVTDDADPCSNASPEPSIAAPGSNVVMELQSSSSILPHNKQHRADLFLMGVVIMVNGYTEPDSETLQRMLHKHGGDLERYETSRITHILADRLSTAKATMHKRQKRSTARPVCKPKWIVDCVAQGKLLPWTDYLLSDVKDDAGTRSAACFFRKDGPSECVIDNPNQDALDDKCTPLEDDTEVVLPQPETSVGPEKPVATGNIASRTGVEHTNASPTNHRGALGNKVRTVGNDPQFLESFFAASRLSFIGSYKQRAKSSSGGGKHSPQSSTFNSKRYIFHVDMDCFFASVALRKFPEYQGKPVAISHLGEKFGKPENPQVLRVASDSTSECATCNYEARKFGIRKGMFLGQAKKLCPDLIVLQYDFEGYEEVSDAVTGILERYAAENDGVVEQVSCDESYAEFYLAEHEGVTSMTFAFELAECIRNEIFDLTQCTASVGVGRNKLLAKLATDHVKPNKSFVVDDDGRSLLRSIQLRELHGVGYRMERKLQEEELVTVSDVLDLGNQGETELSRILGPTLGKKLFGFCHGDDDRPIHPPERKTIGAEVCLR